MKTTYNVIINEALDNPEADTVHVVGVVNGIRCAGIARLHRVNASPNPKLEKQKALIAAYNARQTQPPALTAGEKVVI